MHSHVLAMQRAADPANQAAYRATSVTISGSGFDWHDVESYFRPNAIGNYSFDDDNNVVFNKLDKLFDVAIMMDCSQCPMHPKLKAVFIEYAKKDSDTVRAHGARAGLLHVLGLCRQAGDDGAARRGLHHGRQRQRRAGHPGRARLCRARQKQPDLDLYVADKRHPSLAGTYLAACLSYAALFRQVAGRQLPTTPGSIRRPPSSCRTVAWETVQDYYGK